MNERGRLFRAAAAAVVSCAGLAFGQTAPLPMRDVAVRLDSGVVAAPAGAPGVAVPVYSEWVMVPQAEWLRLRFDQAILSGDPNQGTGSFIRITSALDGAVQTLDARHLADWSNMSARFNGGTVLLEILAYPGTGGNRLSMTTAVASDGPPVGQETICGTVDNRTLSSDPRQGRLMPIGCTAWMIDLGNCANRFLTAGHCISTTTTGATVEFNVPLSTATGVPVAPPPADQFPVVAGSIQSTGNAGIGIDAAQFFTGLSAGTHARVHMGGGAYTLAAAAPGGSGQVIRVTGYGTTHPNDPVVGGGLPLNQSQVQKTHTGPYCGLTGTNIDYTVDTTGGNSGSPVVTEANGLAIGIHTHAGCTTTAGTCNQGTAIQFATLQSWLANPLGPCAPMVQPADPTGGPFAEGGVADHFNRADGPIGSDWSGAAVANFTVSGNRGAHTGAAVEFIQNDAYEGDPRSGVVWVNALMNGTASQFVAVATGMGGTGNYIYAKVQAQTGNGNFSHVAFYTSAGSPWTGGLPFTALGANEFSQGRIRLSLSPDGDTASLDVDTDFDGVPNFTYSSSGVTPLLSGFGKKFGLGAWGTAARWDNWNATNEGQTDNFNRANGPMSGPWAASAGTFANFTISGNAGAHTTGAPDIMRFTGASGDYRSRTQWVDVHSGAGVHYVALCAGLGGADNLFVKIQSNVAPNNFDRVFFYHGNSGGAWAGMTGGSFFVDLATPVDHARVRLTVSPDGDQATFDVDNDFDGVPDESWTRGGLNGISASFGNGFGIGAFGSNSYDNYAIMGNAADTFTRPNGPIGGTWAANTGPIGNFSVSGNGGTYTGGAATGVIQNNGFKAGVGDNRQWVDISVPAGTGTAYVALCGGLGGTDNYFIKVQQNGTGTGFNTAGFYHGVNNSAWTITGGAAFFNLTTAFSSGRIRVTVGPDGDTMTLDIDRNFDGVTDESHSRGGLLGIKAAMGTRFGIGAFGPVSVDNWGGSPVTTEASCYPDCNGDGLLTAADFGCFQTQFVLGTPYADCNGDGVRTAPDFGCFQTKFVLGCP